MQVAGNNSVMYLQVGREAETTLRAAVALRGETGKARAQSRRLRTAAADALAAAEAAARDPPGQYTTLHLLHSHSDHCM